METVGIVPLVPMLLTIKDGQGVPSDLDGAVRVIDLSGAGDGQAVPQGAETVDFEASQYTLSHLSPDFCYDRGFTWALPPTAMRARAATVNLIMLERRVSC